MAKDARLISFDDEGLSTARHRLDGGGKRVPPVPVWSSQWWSKDVVKIELGDGTCPVSSVMELDACAESERNGLNVVRVDSGGPAGSECWLELAIRTV